MTLDDVRTRLAAAQREQSLLAVRVEALAPRAEMDRMLTRIEFQPNAFSGATKELQQARMRLAEFVEVCADLALAVDFLQWVAAKRELAPHDQRMADLSAKLAVKPASVVAYDRVCAEALLKRHKYQTTYAHVADLAPPQMPAEHAEEIEAYRELEREVNTASWTRHQQAMLAEQQLRFAHPIFAESTVGRIEAPVASAKAKGRVAA